MKQQQLPIAKNEPEKLGQFVEIFSQGSSRALIRNLDIEISAATFAGCCFPVSHATAVQFENCYICRPSTAYIDYAIAETRNFTNIKFLKKSLELLINACASLLKASGLDEQVQINNWLFSTNPVPELNDEIVAEIKHHYTNSHPNSTIVIRSLNECTDATSIAVLKRQGFRLLPTRQVYMFGGLSNDGNHRRTIARDQRMLEKNNYNHVAHEEFSDSDFSRCETLYNMLYLEKYSSLNPHYTSHFFKAVHQNKIIRFDGVRNTEGELDAFSGIFQSGNTITQPFVGYDTKRPQTLGLYRMAMSFALSKAIAHGYTLNMSSGAASFKRNRSALPSIEYMAVYNRHLNFKKRSATAVIEIILKTIGIPLLRRFEL